MSIDAEIARSEAKRGRGRPRKPKPEKPLGRLDRDGQEALLADEELANSIGPLVEKYRAAKAAARALNDGITGAAKKSGWLAKAVRKVVVAADEDERFAEERRAAKQCHLAFEAYANRRDLFDGAGTEGDGDGDGDTE
jgi:hypothetical protein